MKRIIIFVLIIVGFSVQNLNGQGIRRKKDTAISFKEFLENQETKKEKGRRIHQEKESSVVIKKKPTIRREVDFDHKSFWKSGAGKTIKIGGITIGVAALIKVGYDFLKNQSDGGRGPAGVPGNGS